jgi:Cys-rich protein (TIGR01571 family)
VLLFVVVVCLWIFSSFLLPPSSFLLPSTYLTSSFFFCLLLLVYNSMGPCCMLAWSRAKTRSLMGLPDEPWVVDMVAACCCPVCTLAQSAVALRKVSLDNNLGLDNPLGMVAPKEQDDMER